MSVISKRASLWSNFLSVYKCQKFLTNAGKELPEKLASDRTLGDNIVQATHFIQEVIVVQSGLETYSRPQSQEMVELGLQWLNSSAHWDAASCGPATMSCCFQIPENIQNPQEQKGLTSAFVCLHTASHDYDL